MKRRTFLETLVVTAGALMVVPGCGDDEGKPEVAVDPSDIFPQSVASGDPKPGSVVLWTRVVDGEREGDDLPVRLEVARDSKFKQRVSLGSSGGLDLTAEVARDHCVKVRVEGLEPGTTYYYRFVYDPSGKARSSRTGRTRTAPAPDADVPVRFAVLSCQDYVGRYYHVLRRVSGLELDFFVHLGDYVYETTGDPSFQEAAGARKVTLSEGAIELGSGDAKYFAAKTLANYRELYRTYRSDPDLQALHEQTAMVAIWDDHEFSDDCYGETATYFDGRQDERDPERRANADQAWFEYMPVDFRAGPDFEFDRTAPFPDNLMIYRDLVFGKHVHLVVTDLRRFRADHVVPEDAFPGAIGATQAELTAALGAVPEGAVPYVDLATYQGGVYQALVAAAAPSLDSPPEVATGNVSAPFLNQLIEAAVAAGQPAPPAIDLADPTLERGIAYHQLLKASGHTSIGSRYLVTKAPFEALAKVKWQQSAGASEDAMGATQQTWFLDTVRESTATWKVWGNEYCFLPREIDLSTVPVPVPEALKTRLLTSAEDWDGMPNRRAELLEELSKIPGVVIVTGDIHAFFVATPHLAGDPSRRVVEFVTSGVSSGTYQSLVTAQASSDPTLAAAGGATLAAMIGSFIASANPHIALQDVNHNGVITVEADGAHFTATLHRIAPGDVLTPPDELESLDGAFETQRFRVPAGTTELEREKDGKWERWDLATGKWS